ncbi:unnamed protein product [Prorocentrum cordatum]|uniref:RecA family profile 1 domain-containing protein n=1 Tax=Prorocentrum cordatum TaxID=2364126 RepID=A0ABN9TXK8_9DINO|nr:unnamed protein product [Polarella glacialis]
MRSALSTVSNWKELHAWLQAQAPAPRPPGKRPAPAESWEPRRQALARGRARKTSGTPMARESTMVRRDIHRHSVLQSQAIPNPVANFSLSRLGPLTLVAQSRPRPALPPSRGAELPATADRTPLESPAESEAEGVIGRACAACAAPLVSAWDLRARWAPAVPAPLPSLSAAVVGGGLAGSFLEVAGPPGVGKTQLCLHLAALAALEGGEAFWLDTEHAFSPPRALELLRALCAGGPEAEGRALEALQRIRRRACSSLADVHASSFATSCSARGRAPGCRRWSSSTASRPWRATTGTSWRRSSGRGCRSARRR